jgi:hypothetical protein
LGVKVRNPYGEVQDTDSAYLVRDANGVVVETPPAYTARDVDSNRVASDSVFYVRDAWGNRVLSNSSYVFRNAYGEVVVFSPPSPGVTPVNTVLPTISGDLVQGGTVTITPGVWTGAVTYRYRVRRGDVTAPLSPNEILMDWTNDTSLLITGIEDDDYLWVDEEASSDLSVTAVATSAAGHGPMEALAPADTTIIGQVIQSNASTALSASYTQSITITDTPARGVLIAISVHISSGTWDGTWSNVRVGGVDATLVRRIPPAVGGARSIATEVWALWGNDLPVGTQDITYSRSTSTPSGSSLMQAIAFGNTQAAAPTDAAVTQFSNATAGTSYSVNTATATNKRLLVAFTPVTVSSAAVLTFTEGTDWVEQTQLGNSSRSHASMIMTRAVATPATVPVAYTTDITYRFANAIVVDIKGDNQ